MAPSVVYLGHKIDAHGLHPTSEKVRAVQEAPEPRNITELKSYLGQLTYYSRFLPDMASTLTPLYALLRKSTSWTWQAQEREAFQASKLLTSSQVLAHFDPDLELILAVMELELFCHTECQMGLKSLLVSHHAPSPRQRRTVHRLRRKGWRVCLESTFPLLCVWSALHPPHWSQATIDIVQRNPCCPTTGIREDPTMGLAVSIIWVHTGLQDNLTAWQCRCHESTTPARKAKGYSRNSWSSPACWEPKRHSCFSSPDKDVDSSRPSTVTSAAVHPPRMARPRRSWTETILDPEIGVINSWRLHLVGW